MTAVSSRERATFADFHAARAAGGLGQADCLPATARRLPGQYPGALGGDGMTQFGRALHALNIDIIGASSSPAKGRVERANETLQDRLVKCKCGGGCCYLGGRQRPASGVGCR